MPGNYTDKQRKMLFGSGFIDSIDSTYHVWVFYLTAFQGLCRSGKKLYLSPTDEDCQHVIRNLSHCYCDSCKRHAVEILAFGLADEPESAGFVTHLNRWMVGYLENTN